MRNWDGRGSGRQSSELGKLALGGLGETRVVGIGGRHGKLLEKLGVYRGVEWLGKEGEERGESRTGWIHT